MDFSALNGHQDMLPPGSPEVARLRADAADLLAQIDARENLHTQKVLPLPAGMWNALYRLEPSGVVVKLSSGDNEFEVDFLRRAASLKLPAPRVLGAGRVSHAALPNATYFLMTYIPDSANAWALAHSSMKIDSLERLGRDLGHILATLHQVHLGYVTRFGVKVDSWKQTLTDGFSPDWDDIAPNALFDGELLPIFKRILQQSAYFSFTDGVLIHGDLNLSNVLMNVNTHCMSAILDPAGCAGMPMFDLAYAAMPWDHGFEFFDSMLAGYRENGGTIDPLLFNSSILVVAYRHSRFHTAAVRESIFERILPEISI